MSVDANQLVQRGMLAHQQGNLAEAERLYREALAVNPDHFEGLHFLGLAVAHRGNPEAGEKLVRRSLEVNRSKPEAFNNHALMLNGLRRHQEAIAACDAALALAPRMVDALIVRCNALRELDRFEEALTFVDRAIAIQPNHFIALGARGDILAALGRHDESIDYSNRALALNPNYLQAIYNRGLRMLTKGQFEQGWPGYERRFELPGHAPRPPLPGFAWNGQPLAGRSILIHEEQGLGDAVQFARYLPPLERQGARVTFVIKPTLWRILRPFLGDIELVSSVPPRMFDYHCMLMSLPAAFKTSVATIPASPSYLTAEAELVERWRGKIGTDGFKVGICWQGNPANLLNRGRAIPLKHYAPLAEIPGVRLICLQTHHGLDQVASLPRPDALTRLGDDFGTGADAFVDLAAAMKCVDLVVTSDTASAHVGGALGVPTWVALGYAPDWRWMVERTDSPWYPSVRLFRQPRLGDWTAALDAIAREIRTMVGVK
ncbi:MAG: tetratricopeptide repeat-containing glycosyltransferase family protein [Xanthobacteraceae bacterium]|nr:tetratricopeptide repeat-containing glycosyltransferase family protein [Xanthobacteraceae bacterium]